MNPPTKIALDIETGGTQANAWIAQIAAAVLTPGGLTFPFECSIGYNHKQPGRQLDASTMVWWADQKRAEAFKQVWKPDGSKIREALVALQSWAGSVKLAYQGELEVWTKGPSFDMAILQHAFDQEDLEFPFDFRGFRCYRTLAAQHPNITQKHAFAHFNVNEAEEALYHTAYSDVLAQGLHQIYLQMK